MKLAGYILALWNAHDLDKVEDICSHWRRGYIWQRIKFEAMAKLLALLAVLHGYAPDDNNFITDALNALKEEC